MAMNDSKLDKCTIVNLDEGTTVEAQFNPKEVSIDKSVPWTKHRTSKGDQPHLEFTAAEGRNVSLELFFDTYEEKADVYAKYVDPLVQMTMVRVNAGKEEDKRPAMVQLVWGAFPKFKGVIESLQTKFTMFLPDGTPVRATCSLKLKEAASANAPKARKQSGGASGSGSAA